MKSRYVLTVVFTLINLFVFGITQDISESTPSIPIDEVAKIIHLLYGPGEGTITFGDIQNKQTRKYYGLSNNDKVLFSSDTLNLTMGTSIMLLELANPNNDGLIMKTYIERLREGGWRHYIGNLLKLSEEEQYDTILQKNFYVYNFSRGIGMTITHIRDASENTLGTIYDYPIEGDFKTYVLLSWGTHIASHNCMNLKASEPQNFE